MGAAGPTHPELAIGREPVGVGHEAGGSQKRGTGPAHRIEVNRDPEFLCLVRVLAIQPEAERFKDNPMAETEEDKTLLDRLVVGQAGVQIGFRDWSNQDRGRFRRRLEVILLHFKEVEVIPILPAGKELGALGQLVELLGGEVSGSNGQPVETGLIGRQDEIGVCEITSANRFPKLDPEIAETGERVGVPDFLSLFSPGSQRILLHKWIAMFEQGIHVITIQTAVGHLPPEIFHLRSRH